MSNINFYNKIYSNLHRKAKTILSYNEELFLERLSKMQKNDKNYLSYDEDILKIKDKYTSYNDFNTEFENTMNKIITDIYYNCESLFEKYNELKMNTLYTQYDKCTLIAGHKYISIDLAFGAFQALIDNEILKNYTSWDELFEKHSNNELLKTSKNFKIETIRNFYKSKRMNIQVFMLNTLNKLFTGDNVIANTFKDKTPNLFLGDELVFDISDDFNKYDDLLGDKTIDGINVHIKKFTYNEIGWYGIENDKTKLSIFPVMEYSNGEVQMMRKAVPTFWLLYNHHHNLEDTPNDYLYQINDYTLTKVIKKPEFITGDELEELKKTKEIV